jgi:hypothetical protein
MADGDTVTIRGQPDIWRDQDGSVWPHTGSQWIQSIATHLAEITKAPPRYLTVDLSNLRFITLFEWTTLVGMRESLLRHERIAEIGDGVASGLGQSR